MRFLGVDSIFSKSAEDIVATVRKSLPADNIEIEISKLSFDLLIANNTSYNAMVNIAVAYYIVDKLSDLKKLNIVDGDTMSNIVNTLLDYINEQWSVKI